MRSSLKVICTVRPEHRWCRSSRPARTHRRGVRASFYAVPKAWFQFRRTVRKSDG